MFQIVFTRTNLNNICFHARQDLKVSFFTRTSNGFNTRLILCKHMSMSRSLLYGQGSRRPKVTIHIQQQQQHDFRFSTNRRQLCDCDIGFLMNYRISNKDLATSDRVSCLTFLFLNTNLLPATWELRCSHGWNKITPPLDFNNSIYPRDVRELRNQAEYHGKRFVHGDGRALCCDRG